ncbi:hypothetical protein NDU88_013033 [Pleurodeles waltl]|uniref:Uncharacterized protein n=1 Tax=Pleurodeles waltl TaxID=8319 RepID=A0AAV7R7J7_PLEWA|nr:hypothetical protein NDU88_013033 [Pleurodeles waltl]
MDKAAAPPAGRPQYCSGSRDDVTPAVTLSLLGAGAREGSRGGGGDSRSLGDILRHRDSGAGIKAPS